MDWKISRICLQCQARFIRRTLQTCELSSKTRISLFQFQRFNPDIAIQYVVPFGLEFDAAGGVGDAFATVVSAINA